ncbi:MAG: ABC transporter permease, partial [Solirubrobacterales bacterium]
MIAPNNVVLRTEPQRSVTDLWGSVLKTTLFGAIIAIVCSYKGMTASGGAEGVGRAVNEAVVIAFMGVFAFNY